jgi:hypothetical protein
VTAPAPVVARIRQEFAAADQAGVRRPGRPTLRQLTGATDHAVKAALAELERELAPPTASMAPETPPAVDEPEPETAPGASAVASAGEAPASLDDNPPIRRGWLALLALPAFVAVWGGWVGLGGLAGFGPVRLLPGIADHFTVNLAVTLPAGMECYAVIGLRVWLSSRTASGRTRTFAAWSTCLALLVGCSGQVAYHVLSRPVTAAPMIVTVFVACLPVAILGVGAALFHLVGEDQRTAGASLCRQHPAVR